MIIPSIDLQSNQAVQLKQGKTHVLTSETPPLELAKIFNRYGPVAVIDLDAAMGVPTQTSDQLPLIETLCRSAQVRVGGGIRSVERATALLKAGADQLIVGTAATPELLSSLPKNRLMVALDHQDGIVVDQGWANSTGETLFDRAARLAPYCSGALVTFVQQEGTLSGFPLEQAVQLKQQLAQVAPHWRLTVAGGIATQDEVIAISQLGLDVQVGMALYTGKLSLAPCVVGALDWHKQPLIPTIVQNVHGAVLMMAYSSPASLEKALNTGVGTYYSRSRQALWVKGETSGNTQQLLSVRADCDRDTLLFTVKQHGSACHTGAATCFDQPQRFQMSQLFDIISQRRQQVQAGTAGTSYTAQLLTNKKLLLQKLLEEAAEVALSDNATELRWEIADLLYFTSVLATDYGLEFSDILSELSARH